MSGARRRPSDGGEGDLPAGRRVGGESLERGSVGEVAGDAGGDRDRQCRPGRRHDHRQTRDHVADAEHPGDPRTGLVVLDPDGADEHLGLRDQRAAIGGSQQAHQLHRTSAHGASFVAAEGVDQIRRGSPRAPATNASSRAEGSGDPWTTWSTYAAGQLVPARGVCGAWRARYARFRRMRPVGRSARWHGRRRPSTSDWS